jgi:hypothetical protein
MSSTLHYKEKPYSYLRKYNWKIEKTLPTLKGLQEMGLK